MPKISVVIEYDSPNDPLWLNPDSVALALHAYCENTKFKVKWAKGGNPWGDDFKSNVTVVVGGRCLHERIIMKKETFKRIEMVQKRLGLVKKHKKVELQCRKLHMEIGNIDAEFLIPDLEKKYIGKHFRRKNSYTSSKEKTDYWWTYLKVIGIDNLQYATIIKFENIKGESVAIGLIKDIIPIRTLDGFEWMEKISKLRFESALKTLLNMVDKVYGLK